MLLAKVVGTVVATRKDPALQGVKLLVIQPLANDKKPQGKPLVALDSIGAGGGAELVAAIVSAPPARSDPKRSNTGEARCVPI